MNTGPYDIIGIDNIISATKRMCNCQAITDYDADIEYFINDGARWMSTQETFIKKSKAINIIDGKARLPKGFHSFIGLRPILDPSIIVDPTLDYSASCNSEMWYYEKAFVENCNTAGCDPVQYLKNTFQIVGQDIVFTYPIPANFTQCLISYNGMATDDNTGLMLLPADYERPLRAFAAWNLLKIYPDLWPVKFQPYYGTRLKDLEKEYKETRAALQSASDLRHWNNTKYQFKRIYRALMQDQNLHA